MTSTEYPSQIISKIFETTFNFTKYVSIYFDFLHITITNRRGNFYANSSTENVKKTIDPQYPTKELATGDYSEIPISQLVTRVIKLFNSNCLCWWVTGIQRGKTYFKPNQCSRVKQLMYMGLVQLLKRLGKDPIQEKGTVDSKDLQELTFNSLQKQALDDTVAIFTSKGLQFSKNEDHESSVKMLRRASELGSSVASYDMGLAYFKGMGVEKNIELALSYFEKASLTGHEKSKQNVLFLRKRMDLVKLRNN